MDFNQSNNNNNTEVLEKEIAVGDRIKVKANGYQKYGIFCDCPNGFSGLIHISNFIPGFVRDVRHFIDPESDEYFEAEVIGIDLKNKRYSLSLEKYNIKENPALVEKYPSQPARNNGDNILNFQNKSRDELDSWMNDEK